MTVRIGIMSDLHLEMEARPGSDTWKNMRKMRNSIHGHPQIGPILESLRGADLVLACGDIHSGEKAVAYLDSVSRFLDAPCLMVCGNHEFYGDEVKSVFDVCRAAAWNTPLVRILENERCDLAIRGEKLSVLGATLWTDMRGFSSAEHLVEQNMYAAKQNLNDCEYVRFAGRKLEPSDTVRMHMESVRWLEDDIPAARSRSDKVVVMTHHAPSLRCVVGTDKAALDFAYASSLERLVVQADLWAFGHTHEYRTYDIGGVPVVTASRGYPSSGWGFDYVPAMAEL